MSAAPQAASSSLPELPGQLFLLLLRCTWFLLEIILANTDKVYPVGLHFEGWGEESHICDLNSVTMSKSVTITCQDDVSTIFYLA